MACGMEARKGHTSEGTRMMCNSTGYRSTQRTRAVLEWKNGERGRGRITWNVTNIPLAIVLPCNHLERTLPAVHCLPPYEKAGTRWSLSFSFSLFRSHSLTHTHSHCLLFENICVRTYCLARTVWPNDESQRRLCKLNHLVRFR